MKKFIISIDGYGLDGEVRYVAGLDSVCCKLTTDLNQAKMFDTIEEAKTLMDMFDIGDTATIEYKEVTCLILLNKEEE